MRNQFKGGFVRSWKPAKSMNDIVWQPSGTKGLQRSVVKWLNEHILNCHPGSEARDARDPVLLQRHEDNLKPSYSSRNKGGRAISLLTHSRIKKAGAAPQLALCQK